MSFGSTNNQQKEATNDLNQGAKVGLDTSSAASSTGFDLLHHAATTLDDPAQYYHSIMAGGSAEDAALAPDINRTRAAADQTMQSTENLAPRGGGRGSVLFGQPAQKDSQVQSIFNSARPAAAQGATQVGGVEGQLGGSALGTGASYLGAGTTAAGKGFDAGTTQYGQQSAFGGAVGSLAGGVMGIASKIPALAFLA